MPDIKTLSVDIETYSSVDLGNCGVHKYVEAPDFTILLFGYSINGEPATCVDFALGEKLPAEIYDALYDSSVEKTAYNAAFERTCIGKYFGRYCEPEQWNCTLVLSATCGLPLSLKQVGEALELGEDKAKMKVGADLIRYFCMPCKPTKSNGHRTRNLPEHDMEKWELFKLYNIRDVDVENTIRKQLIKWRPSFSEHKLWCIDQRINDRGMRVDTALATNAISIGGSYKERLLEQAKVLSGLDNPNSTEQVKAWLEEQEGIEVVSLNKKAVIDVIQSLNKEDSKKFMDLRAEFSKSSTKKYEAILRYVTEDGHVHGCFRFCGAGRTGRWAGQGVQLQNLPQNHMEDLDVARELVVANDEETFTCLYPNVQQVLSELIRTSFIPEEGHRFIVSDFSAIEARVLSWIAGEQWRIDTFANGGDIYCASASQAFKVPVEKHGVNAHLRQKGKIMELACIAEGQLVLTDIGLVPIECVTTDMKVWDGNEWVSHEGVIYKGLKDTIFIGGIELTPDHKIFTDRGLIESGKAEGFNWAEIRLPNCYETSGRPHLSIGKTQSSMGVLMRLWEKDNCRNRASNTETQSNKVLRLQGKGLVDKSKNKTWDDRYETIQCLERNDTALCKSKRPFIWQVRSSWNKCLFKMARVFSKFSRRHGWLIQSRFTDRPNRQQQGLLSGELPMGNTDREFTEQEKQSFDNIMWPHNDYSRSRGESGYKVFNSVGKRKNERCISISVGRKAIPVYDIVNAGANHRFCLYDKEQDILCLCKNCGYGGGVGAMKAFGADKLGMTQEDMANTIDLWRSSSPHIVELWHSVEKAAKKCIATKSAQISSTGNILFEYEDGVMWMTLPSKRRIAYWGADIGENKFGNKSIVYMGQDQTTKKWVQLETFGGKLVENLVQATARDVLKEVMLALTEEGFDIRAHVHDEVIITEPIGGRSVEDVCEIMGRELSWAPGLPLRGDGYECSSYRKD